MLMLVLLPLMQQCCQVDGFIIQRSAGHLHHSIRLHAADTRRGTLSDCFLDTLLERFQGDFDNYNQVVQDRKEGRLPREGGGHEQIHCLLVPVLPVGNKKKAAAARLAAFYFDGIPQRIFRFRYYEFVTDEPDSADAVNMQLHCLDPELEGQLRGIEDPMKWASAFEEFQSTHSNVVSFLENCDVRWTSVPDPTQHAYAIDHNEQKAAKDDTDTGIHAVMIYGEAIVDSTMIPGAKIRILDQLSLWSDQFWIHDRGFDPETGAFIYGNQRGIPYQLERVTNIVTKVDGNTALQERQIVSPSLQWTLGPDWRSEEEYQDKLDAVGGGVSSQLNKDK